MSDNQSYPILIIFTNKECSHCVKMRGKHGWPSDKLESYFPPQKKIDGNSSFDKWDENFFKAALQCGIIDGVQRSRIIEVHFDTLKSSSEIEEVTFFDLSPKEPNGLSIKKYRSDSHGNTLLLKQNKTGFVDSTKIKVSFEEFLNKYIPVSKLRKYVHVFPEFLYVHSLIWDQAIKDPNASLYLRVQGFKTIRDGTDRRVYKIMRQKFSDTEETSKNPIDVLRKLIAFNLEPLYFPSDH